MNDNSDSCGQISFSEQSEKLQKERQRLIEQQQADDMFTADQLQARRDLYLTHRKFVDCMLQSARCFVRPTFFLDRKTYKWVNDPWQDVETGKEVDPLERYDRDFLTSAMMDCAIDVAMRTFPPKEHPLYPK